MDEPRFAQPIPNVTVAGIHKWKMEENIFHMIYREIFLNIYFCVLFQFQLDSTLVHHRKNKPAATLTTVGRDANLPCVVENLGTYKVSRIVSRNNFHTLSSFPLSANKSNKFMVEMIQSSLLFSVSPQKKSFIGFLLLASHTTLMSTLAKLSLFIFAVNWQRAEKKKSTKLNFQSPAIFSLSAICPSFFICSRESFVVEMSTESIEPERWEMNQ